MKNTTKTKRKILKNPKTIEELKDDKGNLIEYAWFWCRQIAYGTRVKYWRDYPEAEDLESVGILKGIDLIRNEKNIEVRNPRNYVMKGMRNSMRNYIYHRTKAKNRFCDEEGNSILLEDITNTCKATESIEHFVYEEDLKFTINNVLKEFKLRGRDYSSYFDYLYKYSKAIISNDLEVYIERINLPNYININDFNMILSLIFWNIK